MTLTAAVLVIISACMHAGWNVFSKSHSPTIGFFQIATLGTVFWFSPILFMTADLLAGISFSLWGILLVAGLFQALYYAGLASSYARGALSIAYPLARSFPLLIVVALTFAAGRGSDLSVLAILGSTAIVLGALILPMQSFRDFRLTNYLNGSCAFAVIAAVGTAGYSFVDDIGMHMIKRLPSEAAGWERALLYLVLECVFTAVWLQALMLFTEKSTARFRANWRHVIKPALLAGFAIGSNLRDYITRHDARKECQLCCCVTPAINSNWDNSGCGSPQGKRLFASISGGGGYLYWPCSCCVGLNKAVSLILRRCNRWRLAMAGEEQTFAFILRQQQFSGCSRTKIQRPELITVSLFSLQYLLISL